MSLIRLHDVSVRFDNAQILREAFFRLEAGDRVGPDWKKRLGEDNHPQTGAGSGDTGHRHGQP